MIVIFWFLIRLLFAKFRKARSPSGGSHALTFGGTSTRGDSQITLTMKSSDHSDVDKDYYGGSSSTVGQDNQIPIFLRRLNDLNTRVGTRTRFLIELDDASGVQVHWYHNNMEAESDRYQYIHEGGFYCLDIVPVTLEDEGLWVCTAQNYAGKSSTAAHLSLIVPKAFKKPIFIEPLKAILTQCGIVSLECKVIGVPTPKLRWYKDDKEIKAGDIFALTANSEDCLGIYTCEATNVMGTAMSTSKIHTQPDTKSDADSLIPYGPSPRFVKGLKNATGKVGNVLILECQVEIPPWPRSVGWYNDAGVVNEGPLYHLIADGMGMYGVEIKSLCADHGTTWKCVVTSLAGAKAVTSCLVTVSYPKNYRVPRFLESLRAIMTDEGLVSFECKVIGYPTPKLSWFKDGKELQPGDVYELTGSKSLGSYCCVARNCMGETSSLAELTVEDIQNQLNESEKLQLTSNTQPPQFLIGLKSAQANINESFTFMIKVATESTPLISWYKEEEELTESNRYKFSTENTGIYFLNIVSLEIDDQSEWKCVAVNKYGQTVTSSFLKLNIPKNFKPPKFLEDLRIAFSNEGSVNLECKVIGVPQPQLKWFKDGQELNPGDMHKIISGQSGTCCLGTYTCQAHNCMGTVSSSATLLTMEDKSTVKSCASEEYLSVGNPLVRNESLSTIPEERTSQMEKSYTIEEPADISFSFDGKEVTVSIYETPDLTHDEALQIIEMYADELSEHISEDNVVDLPSLRIVKESSISGPIMMEALVIDVPTGFCQQQTVSDTEFDGVSITEDTTLAIVDKNDSLCENSLEYFSDHLSSGNSKKDIFYSASETTPKNASLVLRQQSNEEGHPSIQTPKLFMSDSDDQILTQLNLEDRCELQAAQNIVCPLVRSESTNTEEEVSETLADVIENELPKYSVANILTQSDNDGLNSGISNNIQSKELSIVALNSEEDDVLKIISRYNVDEFLKYMKIILEGTMVKMHTHENFNYTDSPTELERSIQALHSLAWKFIEETEKDDVTELDKTTMENVSSLMTAINAGLLALEQIDDPFGVSDNVLNEIQSSVSFDLETLNNKDLSAMDILKHLSYQIQNFTTVVNRQVARVTEQRIMAVLRNTIGTTLVYIKTLQQNSSKIKCININSLAPIFSMIQPMETILNDIALIEEGSAENGKYNLKLKQMLIPPISSIAFSLDNLNTSLKNENSEDDLDLRDIYSKINDATNRFMTLASQGTETHNLAECFISFTKPINDLCCHLRRFGRSTENIISSDYGSDDKLLMDFETLFDELMMDIDTLINNVNVVRDFENNMNPLGSLLEPLQDMKIGLFQVNQVLLSNQTGSNMSYEVMSCFEHLSHQLVQLNNCIINQSIVEEADKEIPFESSIKMMQNILFDDAIDNLGVNGILFGSVMKPLLQLQNLIVSKMASVESDLSFSEHTDATGGAQSLSLSLSNNAQTVFDKTNKDTLIKETVELSGVNNTVKEYDKDNKLLQVNTSKDGKDSTLFENNGENNLLINTDYKFEIENTIRDEEPSIIWAEDDQQNLGLEVLFDETDLETISDFIDAERSNNIINSEIEPVDTIMSKSDIGFVNMEIDYSIVIPEHVLASFDKSIKPDSTVSSSDDLLDELQETLKNITERTLDDSKKVHLFDENSLKNQNLQDKSSCSEELISQNNTLIEESLDEDEPNSDLLIKQDQLEISECNTEKYHHDSIILKLEQDEAYLNKFTDQLKIDQIDKVSEITQDINSTEEIEFVDSDKTLSNNTIITNNGIFDSLEIKTVKINDVTNLETVVNTFSSSTIQNKENAKTYDFSDEVQHDVIINDGQLKIENAFKIPEIIKMNLGCNNEISEPKLLKNMNTIELTETKDSSSETIPSRDIKSPEKQNKESFNFLETNKVLENATNHSNVNIPDLSLVIEDINSSFIQVETEQLAISTLNINTPPIMNFEEQLVLETDEHKLDEVIIEEIVTTTKSKIDNENITELKTLLVPVDECDSGTELNSILMVYTESKNDKTTNKSLVFENYDTTIIEEHKNESNLKDIDKNNSKIKIVDTLEKTFDQIKELTSPLNTNSIRVSKNKTVKNTIDEYNILKENVFFEENKVDRLPEKVEIKELANVDKVSKDDFQEIQTLNSSIYDEQNRVSDFSLIMLSDIAKMSTESTIQNENHVSNSSNIIKSNIESIINDEKQLKNVKRASCVEEKSCIQNIDDGAVYKTEELNEKCNNLPNLSGTYEIDDTFEKMVLPTDVEILVDIKRTAKECNTNTSNEIEDDFTIKQNKNKNIDLKLTDIGSNLELSNELSENNPESIEDVSKSLMVDKLVSTENDEYETVNSIPKKNYTLNKDNDIKEVIAIETDYDALNKSEIISDFSVNQKLIFSNEINVKNSIQESTVEINNDSEYSNIFDKSIRCLEQVSVFEDKNEINDNICELIQNVTVETPEKPWLLTENNGALIVREIVAVESTQPLDLYQFDGNKIKVKSDENRKVVMHVQDMVLEGINCNIIDSELLKTNEGNKGKEVLNDNKNIKKESIQFNTDSSNVSIEQNAASVCDEMNSIYNVQLTEDVLEYSIDARKIFERLNDKNKSSNEKLTPQYSDELTRNNVNKEDIENISNEQVKIQKSKFNDESSNLTENIKEKNVGEKLMMKSKLYYESGIKDSITENEFDKSVTDLDMMNTNTKKDKCINQTHSYGSNYLSFEEDQIKNAHNIVNNSNEQKGLVSIQDNIALNNTEVVPVDFTQTISEPNVCYSYLEENNVNKYLEATEIQTVTIVENADNLKTNNEVESITIKSIVNQGVKNEIDDNDNKPIKVEGQVLIQDRKENVDILSIDAYKELNSNHISTENISETLTDEGSNKITEFNVFESSKDIDENLEKIKQKESNTDEIKKKLADSKHQETSFINLKTVIDNTSLDGTKYQEDNDNKKITNTPTNDFKSAEIECLSDYNMDMNCKLTENSPNVSFCINKEANNTVEQNIAILSSQTISIQSENENNELEYVAELIKRKLNDVDSLILINSQERKESGVTNTNEDDEPFLIQEPKKKFFDKNECQTSDKAKINQQINVSDLEKNADVLYETVTEDKIIDHFEEENLSDLTIKPKLHCIEKKAAYQTECIVLENPNILKPEECNKIENIIERVQIEHELNIAAIGNIVMNYDSLKENTSKSSFDLRNVLESAKIATIDDYSNEIVVNNINIFNAFDEDLCSRLIESSASLNDQIENDHQSSIQNKQIKNINIQDLPTKLESFNVDGNIFKEISDKNKPVAYDVQEPLNKVVSNVLLDNQENMIKIESKLKLDSSKENNIMKVSNNDNDENVVNETVKTAVNVDLTGSQKNSKFDSDKMVSLIEDRDKYTDKKKKKSPQPQDKKLLSLDTIDNNKGKINENKKNIESIVEEKILKPTEDTEKVKINESNFKQVIIKKNNEENSKVLQNEDNENAFKETNITNSSDELTENKIKADSIQIINDWIDEDQKTQNSKAEKTSKQAKDKKYFAPDELLNNSEIENKIYEKTKIVDLISGENSKMLLEDREKIINLESTIKLNSSNESNINILKTSNNENNENVIKNTDEIVENDSKMENQEDKALNTDKTQMIRNEVDIDKRKRGSKKKKTSPQPQSKKSLSPNKSLENSESEMKINENNKIIRSTTEEKSKNLISKLDQVTSLENNETPSKTLKNKNNEIDKIFSNNDQTENNIILEADNKKIVKNETDTSKEKCGSKKKKTSPSSLREKSVSSDNLIAMTRIDHKIKQETEVNSITDSDVTKDKNISSNKSEKNLSHTSSNKNELNTTYNEIKSDNVPPKFQKGSEIVFENNKTKALETNDKNKKESKESGIVDNVLEYSSEYQYNIEENTVCGLGTEKLPFLEDFIKTTNVQSVEKWQSTVAKEIEIIGGDHEEKVNNSQQEYSLKNPKSGKEKQKDLESKTSKEGQIKDSDEIKGKTQNKDTIQRNQDSHGKSRLRDTTSEIWITDKKFDELHDNDNIASPVKQVKSFDAAGTNSILDDESDYRKHYARNCFTTPKDKEFDSGEWMSEVNADRKIGMRDEPIVGRRNIETRSLTPCRGFERSVTSMSIRSEELLARNKDTSLPRRYLSVVDAYRSRLTPLTYRSLTPELLTTSYRSLMSEMTRFLESTNTYKNSTVVSGDVDRYHGAKSSSLYLEPTKSTTNTYYSRNPSPAMTVYRSPSETVFRAYHRPNDEDLSLYSRRRRRGSDSFLLGVDSRDHYSRRFSDTKGDLNRTKEIFKRLYFCVQLIDQTISSGARVKFWCSVIGYPEPRVQWYRDGQKLNSFNYNSSTRYQTKYMNGLAQLIIDDAQSGDSGEYMCVAVNSGDRISTSGFLTVYTSPTVFGVAPKTPLQSASPLEDRLKSTSLNKFYLWSGDNLPRSVRISSDWRSYEDKSRYSKYPKFMTTIIADDVTTYGGTIALHVRVQGSPLPNVTWMRESKPLPRLSIKYVYLDEGGLYTLLVKDSTARDSGTYVCRACNLYGTANTEKAIRVVSPQDYSEHRGVKPAIIVSRPDDRLNVVVGEDITVTLRVAGEPKPKVVWMRGSRDITFLDRSLKETVNDYVKLSIKKAQLSDAGTYFIIAKNVYGSDRAFVTVGVRKRARSLTPPQIRNTISRWIAIYNGGCSAKNGVPGPVRSEPVISDRANNRISLRWNKPDKADTVLVYNVEAQSKNEKCWSQVGMTPTNTIDLYNLKPGNQYVFRVTARNRFGWGQPVVTSDYIDIWELKCLPEFCQPLPGETKVLLHHSVKLQCHVRGHPVPRVTWFKDGEPLNTEKYTTEYTEMGRCTLTITDAVDEDAGRYMCEAVNDCGRVSTLTVVDVMANRRIVEAEQRLQGCLMKNSDFKESAPIFTKRLISRRVEINSTVRLSCQVHGLPVPSVLWLKDNRPVDFAGDKKSCRNSDNFSTLELTKVKYDDSGEYTAVASNSIGTASTRCMLEVINKYHMDPAVPEFIFGLPPSHKTTDSIILNAQIDAYRPVKVEWFRDGIQLRNGRRVDIITDHNGNLELRIACVTKRDSGTYILRVSNDTGTIESRCEVDVVERNHFDTGLEEISSTNYLYSKKPKFVVKPKFQEIEEGQEVIIDSEIVGDPLPKISWLRDGLKPEYYRDNSEFTCISRGNCHQLKISHAKLTHTGTYTLLATNSYGQIKALISLQVYSTGHYKKKMENGINRTTVQRLPRISRGLFDVECSENDCVAFECKLNITQDTDIRWQKDGKLVRLDKEIKSELVGGDTARLEIAAVGPLHEGLYTCTAFNELGQDSTSARLIISDSVREVIAKSMALTNGQRKTMLGSPKLAGESNDRGSKRFKRSSAPKFYAVLHDKIADVGETVRFQCSVSGHPPPWSSWEKDNQPIGINSRMKIREDDDNRSLEICDITADDAGLYRITVENKFGKIRTTARLEVMTHQQTNDVKITSLTNGRRQSGSTACAGENFTLSCDIRGNSMSEVTWYKNDEVVKSGDRVTLNQDDLAARLSISNLELADTGMYTCIARCKSGVTRCSTELCVFDTKLAKDSYLQPPIFVEGLVPMRIAGEGERLELTVKLQGAVPMSATWFKDNIPVPDCEDFAYMVGNNGKFSLSIVDPFSADSGNYSCKVVNTFGEAESHGQLVIKEIENLPVQRATLQDTHVVSTELNNNSKVYEKNACDIPQNEELIATAVTTPLPATILWGPCDTTVLRGARVVLETSYAGNPEPCIQWLRAGKVLVDTDERLRITNADCISSLTIDSITADDCGKYIVRVDNGLGNDYHFASVAVEGPPDPPAGRPVVSVSETSADVTWPSPAYDGGCMVTGYSVEVRPFNQSDWKLVADKCHSLSHIVRGLAPGESYVFRVRAENMHGSSEASLESIPVYILQTDYGNTLVPKKVNIENGELFTKQYDVLDELGKGRYGVVRKVKERETNKYYAAKFVRCIKSKDKEKAQEEVDIMNCLRHPKLLQLDAAYDHPREVVMVTEYISGGELFERVVADDFTLTEKDCILFTRQICEGVDYMHKQNVVHLDLKPENIMCQSRTSHQIKLIDFGLAQKIESGKPIRVLFGTPEFIPPEIISYEPIGVESDMWSVGVICYVLLSGLSPFMGDNDAETFTNITKAEFDFDDESFDAISQDSKDFISALLIKRKEKRLTARECLKHKWLAQQDMDMSCVILSTDKLKKFIIRRKWQKTGNAIRALGRMATLSAASRRGGGAGGGGGGGGIAQQLKMASLSEEESVGELSSSSSSSSSPLSSSPSPPHHDDKRRTSVVAVDVRQPKTTVAEVNESTAMAVAMCRGGRRSCDVRSDSGFSECSSLASSSSSSYTSSTAMATGYHHARLSTEKPLAIAEEMCHQPPQLLATSRLTANGAAATRRTLRSPAHVLLSTLGTGAGISGVCQKNRLIFDGTRHQRGTVTGAAAGAGVVGGTGKVTAGATTTTAGVGAGAEVHRKEPIRIQTTDNFKKAVAFWKQ